MFKLPIKIYGIIIAVSLLPLISFAQVQAISCSKGGYTIETINGIFTKEGGPNGDAGAVGNRNSLKRHMGDITVFNGEPLTFDYLYNPTHGLFGVIDLTDVAIQKTFESVDMKDPDFLKILNDASTQVKTQKVLLVAHSQGNFYANNFYKVVTDSGDVSKKSIGVYGVATPANSVAGNGTYRTSGTDTVINRVRRVLPGTVLPKNDDISYLDSDDSGHGHGFREVYLEYRGEEIKKEIEESLSILSVDPSRPENSSCINPPKALSTIEKVTGPVVYATDFALATGAVGIIGAKNIAVGTYHIAVNTVVWTYDTSVAVAKWTYHTSVAVVVWTFDTGITIAKVVGNTAVAVASTVYDAVAGALTSKSIASNNMASVILATQTQPQAVQSSSLVSASNNKTPIVTQALPANNQMAPVVQNQPQTVFVFEPKVQNSAGAPKLVFVGSFGSSGGSTAVLSPQVLGSQTVVVVADEATTDEEIVGGAGSGVALAAPALSALQCAQTLAVDGCLLATTTVHFEWSTVPGADHYLVNKNGEYATTTETSLDITARDFSDYTFGVVAADASGQASATSTQAVSVATIPIAINEIAWMGTVASPNDEWFEIKNNTAHTIDLSQWELNAKDGTPHVKLTGTIASHAYLVFERTNDTVVADVVAHATTTGALNNPGDQLTLLRDSVVFDQTPDGAWPAGFNSTSSRQTMERYSSKELGADASNWGTNLGYIKNGTDAKGNAIDGTPGAQNSVSTLINKGQDITSDFTLTNAEEQYVIASTLRVNASSTLTIEPGVEIKFYDGWIRVAGQLVVAGTQENPVTIGTLSGNQDGGISVGGGYTDAVYQGTNASAVLDHVNIENIDYIDAYDNARLSISDTELLNSTGGIYASGNAQISIASSSIRNTQDNHAVAGYENSQVTIESSTITNTLGNDAVGVYDGTMTITNTTIDGVPDDGGIYAYRATLDISNSTIKNVSDTGMSLYGATSTISNVTIENAGNVGIEIYYGQATIASTTISNITGWAGISVDYGALSISSSTIKNVSDYGIATYNATSTIANMVVENGGGNGIDIYQGTATIANTTVSGFGGSGISVTDPTESVAITGGEITGNTIGVEISPVGTATFNDVFIHDNGISETII